MIMNLAPNSSPGTTDFPEECLAREILSTQTSRGSGGKARASLCLSFCLLFMPVCVPGISESSVSPGLTSLRCAGLRELSLGHW